MVDRHQDVQCRKVPTDVPYPAFVVHSEETFSGGPDCILKFVRHWKANPANPPNESWADFAATTRATPL